MKTLPEPMLGYFTAGDGRRASDELPKKYVCGLPATICRWFYWRGWPWTGDSRSLMSWLCEAFPDLRDWMGWLPLWRCGNRGAAKVARKDFLDMRWTVAVPCRRSSCYAV